MQHHQEKGLTLTIVTNIAQTFSADSLKWSLSPGAHINYYKHWQAISLLPRHITIWNILGEPWKTECGCPRGIENGHRQFNCLLRNRCTSSTKRETQRMTEGLPTVTQESTCSTVMEERTCSRYDAGGAWHWCDGQRQLYGDVPLGCQRRPARLSLSSEITHTVFLVSPCHQKSHIQCFSRLSLSSEITHTMFLVSPCHQKSYIQCFSRLSLSSEITHTMFLVSLCHQKSLIQCSSSLPVIRNHTYNVPRLSLSSEITHTMFLVSPCLQKSLIQCSSSLPVIRNHTYNVALGGQWSCALVSLTHVTHRQMHACTHPRNPIP